jgi:hypothetical protein
LKPGPEGTLPFILAEQEAKDLVVPLLYETVVLNAASVGHTVVDTVVSTVVVVGVIADVAQGPFSPGGPDVPTGEGAAEAQSAQMVSESRETSCEGIWRQVGIVLMSSQLLTPDGLSFIQERDLRRRISGTSCLTGCHCMSLFIVGSYFAPRRFRMNASTVHIFA